MTQPVSEDVLVRPLAIVGASARAAAYSAVRAGYRPLTADLFADADLRHIATATRVAPYPEGLLDWIRAVGPAAWMYTGALENHPELVDAMGWLAPLWGNSGEVLKCIRQPWNLMDALRDAGLEFPETRSESHGLPQDGSWLAKTYRGASGSGVRELSSSHELPVGDETVAEPVAPVYQERMAGTPCSGVFVAARGRATLLGLTRQFVGEPWLNSRGFQYAGSIGPWPVDDQTLATIRKIGNVLADRFELVGLCGVDFILDRHQVWTLEVNPRFTASVEIVERATGVHAIAAHVAACMETSGPSDEQRSASVPAPTQAPLTPTEPAQSNVHGKAILYAKQDVAVSETFAEWSLDEALRTPWPSLADVSPAGTLIESGRPVLTFFAEDADTRAVESRLRERVAEIEQRLYAH